MVGAEFELEKAIAALIGDGASAAQAQAQLGSVTQLRREIGSANPDTLAALRSEVTSIVAQTHTLVQESRAVVAAGAARAEAADLASLAATSRAEVTTLMQDMHRFDPYLRFASADEEEAYRQREAQRRAYIDAQHAKSTPEGNLNAAGGAIGQMVDAKAHGAGESPEFQQRWNDLVSTTEKLRDEVRRSGGSTKEFDDRLREDLRRILKAKGLTDAQIDAQFAAHPDPLEAAKAYVQDGETTQRVSISISKLGNRMTDASTIVAAPAPVLTLNFDDVAAELCTTGTVTAEQQAESPFAHGLQSAERPAPNAGRSGPA